METWIKSTTPTIASGVLSLPMRDGNIGSGLFGKQEEQVLSLPMRDGNRNTYAVLGLRNTVLSLPMRDGND